MPPRPVVVAVASDLHANSTVGLCPPTGLDLDDGQRVDPSALQEWLWRGWEGYAARVAAQVAALDAELYVVLAGDLVEGDHHRTTQIMTRNLQDQHRLALACLAPLRALHPARWFVVRGTEAHVGPGATTEELIAETLEAEPDPETGRRSWWHLRAEILGTRFDVAHHGRTGSYGWTRNNGANSQASQVFWESARRKADPPHYVIRGHRHKRAKGSCEGIEVHQLGCWQMSTSYGHKVAPDSLPDIGALIVTCHPGAVRSAEVFTWEPDPAPVWRVEAPLQQPARQEPGHMTERERVDDFVSELNAMQARHGISVGFNVETCQLMACPGEPVAPLTVVASPNYYRADWVDYALLDPGEVEREQEREVERKATRERRAGI